MARLEFFFDCSSPWTYLAFTRVQAVVEWTKAEIVWRPILVGGVFNAVNRDVYERRANPRTRANRLIPGRIFRTGRGWPASRSASRRSFRCARLRRCARYWQRKSRARWSLGARGVRGAYWGDLKDISHAEVLDEVCLKVNLNPAAIRARAESTEIRDRLRANTEEVIARGGFGSPTMFVDGDDMYFGNDRLPLVEAALMR